jgi:hypothetical protein
MVTTSFAIFAAVGVWDELSARVVAGVLELVVEPRWSRSATTTWR